MHHVSGQSLDSTGSPEAPRDREFSRVRVSGDPTDVFNGDGIHESKKD
jgi:hypothetical protein